MKRLLDETTIRSQIMVALLLVGLLPLVLVTLQSLHCAHEGMVEVQRRQLTRLLALQEARLENWVDQRANLLRLAGSCSAMQELMTNADSVEARSEMISYLEEIQNLNPTIEAIAIFDKDWQLMAKGRSHTHAASDLLAPGLTSRLADAQDIVWSEDLHNHGDDYVAVHVGYPLRCKLGKTQGYLIASVMVNEAVSGLEDLVEADAGASTYVVGTRELRYVSVPAAMHHSLGKQASLPKGMQARITGLQEYENTLGRQVIGMGVDLPELPWKLVVELDRDQAFGLVHFLLRRASYMAVFIAIVLLAIALPVARLLSRPLQELRDTCQRIAAGASGQRVASLKGREAREVAASFNSMMDRLQDTQRQLVQAGALAAVGELSASIVHEMRNPLNTIQMNLQAIRRKVGDDPKYLELQDLAERQTRRLQDMLNRLLSFGKPLELVRAPLDLREVVGDVHLALRQQAERHGISIKEDLPQTPVPVLADREHMYRVLANLVENAIHVQGEGGEIVLQMSMESGQCRLQVHDRGPGIPEGMRDRVFLPFFTNRPAGTGLGLAIARKIVELHDGAIEVTATGPAGTTMTVCLPLSGGGQA